MDEILEFLNRRVEYLKGFDEDDEDDFIDGEEVYSRGIEQGRFGEAVFIRDKIKKMMEG